MSWRPVLGPDNCATCMGCLQILRHLLKMHWESAPPAGDSLVSVFMCLMEKNWLAGVFDEYDEMMLKGFAMQAGFLESRKRNMNPVRRECCS
jgi:hypothetical protein